jgi:hypothetical protein
VRAPPNPRTAAKLASVLEQAPPDEVQRVLLQVTESIFLHLTKDEGWTPDEASEFVRCFTNRVIDQMGTTPSGAIH